LISGIVWAMAGAARAGAAAAATPAERMKLRRSILSPHCFPNHVVILFALRAVRYPLDCTIGQTIASAIIPHLPEN
jgi:hypothetical protein